MNTGVTFSKSEFFTELCRFRELFGTKPFWAQPSETRQAAIKGLMHVYFNLEIGAKDLEPVSGALKSALNEYTMREGLMVKHGMVVGL